MTPFKTPPRRARKLRSSRTALLAAGACLSLGLAHVGPAAAALPARTDLDATPQASGEAGQTSVMDDLVAAVQGDRSAQVRLEARVGSGAEGSQVRNRLHALFAGGVDADVRVVNLQQRDQRARLTLARNGERYGVADVVLAPDGGLLDLQLVPIPRPYSGPAGPSPASTAELAEAIDERVRFAVDNGDFSGAVLVTGPDGSVVYARAFGEADREAGSANELGTRFNLGSMDKQFTGVAIARLVEQGRLSLDDTIGGVLPDYPGPPEARAITVEQLLNHESGLGMLFDRAGWDWKFRYDEMADLFPIFAGEPLAYAPGSQSTYSNEGYIVLGAMIERLTGQSWYDHVREQVFEPAGMEATAYLTDDRTLPSRATGYAFAADDPFGLGDRRASWDTLSWKGNSCGGGFSTVGDITRFLRALRAGALVPLEQLPLPEAGPPARRFGLEFIPVAPGRTLVGHSGGGPASGINAEARIIWETGHAYAVLGNLDAPFAQMLARDLSAMLVAQGPQQAVRGGADNVPIPAR